MKRMLLCQTCLRGSMDGEIGDACQTEGCSGKLEVSPTLNDVTEQLPEPMECPRRAESPLGDRIFPPPDYWRQHKSNGDRVCSYCGSLHPEDFFRLVRESADAPTNADYSAAPSIEPSTKGYKVYVHRGSVRNATEGGIKFYKQHLRGLTVTDEQETLYAAATKASHVRFQRHLARSRYRGNTNGES